MPHRERKNAKKKSYLTIGAIVAVVIIAVAVIPQFLNKSSITPDTPLNVYLMDEMYAKRGTWNNFVNVSSIDVYKNGQFACTAHVSSSGIPDMSTDLWPPNGFRVGDEITLIRTWQDGYKDQYVFTASTSLYYELSIVTYFCPSLAGDAEVFTPV